MVPPVLVALLGCSSALKKIGPVTPLLPSNRQIPPKQIVCKTLGLLELSLEEAEVLSVTSVMARRQISIFQFLI